jgi:threonine dehydrogenase-like Zn-dependent dehydrogenase
MITHVFPLEQFARAIELAAHPVADSCKVIIGAQERGPASK